MLKTIFAFCSILLLSLPLSGCSLFQAQKMVTNSAPEYTTVMLLPTENYLKYCDGANMDSEGFKKTITKTITITIPGTNLSLTQIANQKIQQAAQKADITYPQSNQNPLNYVKVIGATAYIEPTEGWAGVSIFLCYWKPFVEMNLLSISGIQKVEWVSDQNTWGSLK